MPRIPPRSLNIQHLARTDHRTAQVAHALNDPRQGGVNLDNNPLALTWDEFHLAAPGFLTCIPVMLAS